MVEVRHGVSGWTVSSYAADQMDVVIGTERSDHVWALSDRYSATLFLHPLVHHSLVGMLAGALTALDRAAYAEVLQQCRVPTPRAVCLYDEDESGRVLAVSRKGDRSRFGLPGGKVDPGETDLQAVVRELKEETGLDVADPVPVFEKMCWGSTCYVSVTFAGKTRGAIHTDEPVDVRWVDKQVLLDGPFGDYNRRMLRALGRTP